MTAVFERMLEMSAMATVVIAVVMLIRLLLRKAPRKYSYALWSVAAFRLVCPVSFRAFFSLFNFTKGLDEASMETILPNPVVSPAPVVSPGYFDSVPPGTGTPVEIDPDNMFTYPITTPPAAETPVTASIDWMQVLAIVWLVGLAALLIYGIVSYIRLRRRMSTAVLLEGNVWQSDRVQSPFILGFIRPKIYLPFGLGEEQQRYVLAHERYHLKRLDHIVRPLSFLILAIHWFNPLVWVAYYMMSRDMEMSCDEKVLSGADNIRKAYSITLLSFAANRRFPSPSPLAFGESGVKGRIKNVLNWKKPRTWVTVIAIIVCIVVIIVCAANPASHPRDWTKDLTVEDVDWAELSFYTEQWNYRRLSGEELEELVELLNGLRRREMKQPPPRGSWGFPSERMVTICCNGIEYKLNLGPSPMTLDSKDEGVDWGTGDPWFVDHEELKQFIRELEDVSQEITVGSPIGLSYAPYEAVESLYLTPLSSSVAYDGDGKRWYIGTDRVTIYGKSNENEPIADFTNPTDWWVITEEEWAAMFLTDTVPDISGFKTVMFWKLSEECGVLYADRELWAIRFQGDYVWSVHRLAQCEAAPAVPGEKLVLSDKLLFAALNDEVEIIDTGLGMTDVLSKLVAATAPSVEMRITEVSAVDLDGDGLKELLLLLETPGTVYGTKILHYNAADQQVCAYDLWYRAFMDVKTDGTFAYSGGAADNGFGRISFTADGYEVEKITYSESWYPDHEVNCYVNGEPATEQEFVNAFAAWQETPGVTWIEYDPVNALRLLCENPATEEPETTTELSHFLADLTHDGVQETITLSYHEEWRHYTLTVSNSAGEIIWTGEANLAHAGWNGLYLYQKDNRNYLMRWLPGGSTGSFNYYYQIFSLAEDGTELLLAENNFRFDAMSVETVLSIDVDGIRAFEKEVNALLEDTIVLITTDEGTPYYSTPDVTLCKLWTAPIKEVQEWKQNVINRLPLVMAYMELEPTLLASVEKQVAIHMGDYDLAYVERVEEIGQSAYRVTFKPGDYDGIRRVTWQDSRYFDIVKDENGSYVAKEKTSILASLPFELVTPDTLPTDPEEYYLVAALPENHVYLYAKNHGEDSMLLWNGNFWWPLTGRTAHTPRMNLPRLYLMDENAQTTTVAAISERASGTEVSVEQLVVYVMGEYQVDSSYYTGLKQSVYDWSSVHEAFNKKNTLVYDADTNSFTVFWNGRVYNSGELSEDMGRSLDLEDGYTGSLFANGDIIKFAYIGGNRFTVTVKTAVEDRPLSIGATGLDLTWTVEFNGEGFDLVGEISLGSEAGVNQGPSTAESEHGVAELPNGWKLNDFTIAGFDRDGLGDFGYRTVLSEDELKSLPELLDLSEWQELASPPEYGLTVCLVLSDSDTERFLYVLDGMDGNAVIKLSDPNTGESFVYLASEECIAYAKALAAALKDRAI